MFFKKFRLFKKKEVEPQIDEFDEKLSRINDEIEENTSNVSSLSKHDLKALKKEEFRNKKIVQICSNITNAKNEIKQSIDEFDKIKNRLNDVEKIRDANDERKKRIIHIVEKINNLTSERAKYEKSQDMLEIDTNHYLILEKNENIMVNEIKKLEGYEKEYLAIRSDLHKLEGERGNLSYERNKLLSKKSLLKYYVRLLIVVSVLLFGMFGFLAYTGKLKSLTPVIIIVGAIALNTVYVINAIRDNVNKLEANRIKENKLIGLFNKVKIKYVNSVKVVEYVHRKFDIHNCKELKLLWERYLKEKDRKFRFNQIVELMGVQNESLELELDKLELEDKQLWKQNTGVFNNVMSLDMIEHKLNDEKNNIKKSIEHNKIVVTTGMKDIKTILNTYEEYKDEIIDVMRECKLFT